MDDISFVQIWEVVVVEITLLTSILSSVTWTVAYSEFWVSSGKVDGRCGEVGCRHAWSKFHSCGEETEKPLLLDRSFRYRGTRSWTWDDDRRLRLAGMSFTEWHSSIKYSGERPARQLLVMELSLYRIRNGTGSQWGSGRIAAEIGSYLIFLRIKRAAASRIFKTDWRRSIKEVYRHLGFWRNRLTCRWRHGPEFGWLMM